MNLHLANVKRIVNDKELYEALMWYLDEKIDTQVRRCMYSDDDRSTILAQGEYRALQKLKKIRDDVNGRD